MLSAKKSNLHQSPFPISNSSLEHGAVMHGAGGFISPNLL